jgi:hypothetical protein
MGDESGFAVGGNRVRQVHDPQGVVNGQPHHQAVTPSPPTKNHRRAMANTRGPALHQRVKIEHRQRLATILGEADEMGP